MTAESADSLRDGAVPSCRWCERTLPLCVSALVLLTVGLGTLCALAAGPLHAQCAVEWKIGIPCFDVSALLVNQMKEWSTETCPGTSQRCRYSLISVNADDITATHTTPVMRFVDDITFNLSSPHPDTCDVQGRSVSRSWFAMIDSGTNYLNMYNLMREVYRRIRSDHTTFVYVVAAESVFINFLKHRILLYVDVFCKESIKPAVVSPLLPVLLSPPVTDYVLSSPPLDRIFPHKTCAYL